MKTLSTGWRAAAAMAAVALATGALAAPGQLDATFGTGGIVRTRVGSTTDIAVAAAKLADGRYVVLATSDDDNDIAQVFVSCGAPGRGRSDAIATWRQPA